MSMLNDLGFPAACETDVDNAVMMRVLDKQQVDWDFAYASAMVWSYFAIVMAVVGVVVLIVNRFVFYEVD